MSKRVLLSRDEARQKIVNHWLETYTPRQLLDTQEPDWKKLRNYEYEDRLKALFGSQWCINEPCPFNGWFCTWGEEVCDRDLEFVPCCGEQEK